MTGQTLSHYRVFERIGEGATSVVYKAEDLSLGRPVALKLLPPGVSVDFGAVARFQHEARTASSLSHPNICTIYETGEHEGRHFIVMEYLEGQVLSRMIAGRPLDCYRLLEIAIQIADGLAAAHAEHVVHQDIKPANIYITQHDHVKLLDFGLAVLMPTNFADRGSTSAVWLAAIGGTAPYMSPEQTYGEQLDPRSDLFSFGVTVYEMAAGRRPFTGGSTTALMDAIRTETPARLRQVNPSVPEELERIVEKALEKNRKLRYQTASDIGADLRRLKRDLDSQNKVFAPPRDPNVTRAVSVTTARRRARIGSGTIGAAAAAVTAATLLYVGVRALVSGSSEATPEFALTSAGPRGDIHLPASNPAPPPPGRTGSAGADDRLVEAPASTGEAAIDGKSGAAPVARGEDGSSAVDRAWAREQLAAARSKVDLELYDQAIGSLEAMLARDGSSEEALEAYLLMAYIHETRDRQEDAISTYLDIVTRFSESPRAPEVLLRMADAMLRSKRRDKDSEALKIYAGIADRYPESRWTAGALMAKGQLEERLRLHHRDAMLDAAVPSALVTYRQLVDRYPASSHGEAAMWKLSQLYQRIKRYDLAARALEQLAASYPESRHDGWFAAAEIYEKRLKEPLNARAAYARVPTSSPKFEEAQKRLARQ